MDNKILPEVGKKYHFFDDGKLHMQRHYIATVLRIVPFDEAKDIVVKEFDYNLVEDGKAVEECLVDQCIIDTWHRERDNHPWLYPSNDYETDYFIEISVPEYDEYNLWAVRTNWGYFFTMDIQSSWQGGVLDVDGRRFAEFKQILEMYNSDENAQIDISQFEIKD